MFIYKIGHISRVIEYNFPGQMGSISISPGKTMKIIATIVGPIKRFVDMEVLVTEMDPIGCPLDPQVVETTAASLSRPSLSLCSDCQNC